MRKHWTDSGWGEKRNLSSLEMSTLWKWERTEKPIKTKRQETQQLKAAYDSAAGNRETTGWQDRQPNSNTDFLIQTVTCAHGGEDSCLLAFCFLTKANKFTILSYKNKQTLHLTSELSNAPKAFWSPLLPLQPQLLPLAAANYRYLPDLLAVPRTHQASSTQGLSRGCSLLRTVLQPTDPLGLCLNATFPGRPSLTTAMSSAPLLHPLHVPGSTSHALWLHKVCILSLIVCLPYKNVILMRASNASWSPHHSCA